MHSVTVSVTGLESAGTQYVNPGVGCRLVGAFSAVNTALTTAASAITISDGTTDVGVITIAHEAAVGTCDAMVIDTTSEGKVAFSKTVPVKITNDDAPGAGAANITLVFDEFSAGI